MSTPSAPAVAGPPAPAVATTPAVAGEPIMVTTPAAPTPAPTVAATAARPVTVEATPPHPSALVEKPAPRAPPAGDDTTR
ncbi:hypothetical protein AB0J74_16245 [Asanoa sp. NPDC049573]|uniref:hypothetical protein n=1 Tax=Asanoa sp. NPDC049573 TaxID=3155396 RepID=UPI003439A6F4